MYNRTKGKPQELRNGISYIPSKARDRYQFDQPYLSIPAMRSLPIFMLRVSFAQKNQPENKI
jgi:hypothetical protein